MYRRPVYRLFFQFGEYDGFWFSFWMTFRDTTRLNPWNEPNLLFADSSSSSQSADDPSQPRPTFEGVGARSPRRTMPKGSKVSECLHAIGVDPAALCDCADLDEEWGAIKKAYFKKILRCHPDKGGDAAEFRDVNAAFEVVRGLFEKRKVTSFAGAASGATSTASAFASAAHEFDGAEFKSWDFYAEAAATETPPYRTERAKSDRSQCKAKGAACRHGDDPRIAKGAVRVGTLDPEAGGYGRWVHLHCWRVPARIWLGLPDPAAACADPARFEAALLGMNEVV